MAYSNHVYVDSMEFDALFYMDLYADVAAAVEADQFADEAGDLDGDGVSGDYYDQALYHYNTYGWAEGRDPNLAFDTSGYLDAYDDVAEAGVNPFDHYREYGIAEQREADSTFAGIDVNEDGVIATTELISQLSNAQLQALEWDGVTIDGFLDVSSIFDEDTYLATYEDVAAAQPDDMSSAEWAFYHWTMYGQFEGTSTDYREAFLDTGTGLFNYGAARNSTADTDDGGDDGDTGTVTVLDGDATATDGVADNFGYVEGTSLDSEVTGFNVDEDMLTFDLTVASDATTLDGIDGLTIGTGDVAVQINQIDGDTFVNLGLDEEGEVIGMTIAGVADPSTIDIAVV